MPHLQAFYAWQVQTFRSLIFDFPTRLLHSGLVTDRQLIQDLRKIKRALKQLRRAVGNSKLFKTNSEKLRSVTASAYQSESIIEEVFGPEIGKAVIRRINKE